MLRCGSNTITTFYYEFITATVSQTHGAYVDLISVSFGSFYFLFYEFWSVPKARRCKYVSGICMPIKCVYFCKFQIFLLICIRFAERYRFLCTVRFVLYWTGEHFLREYLILTSLSERYTFEWRVSQNRKSKHFLSQHLQIYIFAPIPYLRTSHGNV